MLVSGIRPKGSAEVAAMRISGEVYFLKDLPPPDTVRWVVSKKTVVAAAVIAGLLNEKQVLERYPTLTLGELRHWVTLVRGGAFEALCVTKSDSGFAGDATLLELSESFLISVGDITLSSSKGVLICAIDTKEIALSLTRLELRILGCLMLNAGSVVQRSWLVECLYKGRSKRPSSKMFDVIVCKLRKRIKDVLGRDPIKTEWGRGYFVPTAQ